MYLHYVYAKIIIKHVLNNFVELRNILAMCNLKILLEK